MYRTSAALAPHGLSSSALGLRRIVHRRFPAGQHRIDDEFSLRHFQDLTGAYGVAHRPELAERGNPFAAMAAALITEHDLVAEPVRLGVVAHATPDLDCRLAAPTYLSEVLVPDGLSFTLTDNGVCAPFAALRLASCYAQRHGWERALVVLADQAALPYEPDCAPAAVASGDAAVVLLLERDRGHPPVAVRERPGVARPEVPAAIEAVLDELSGDERPVVVAGPALDPERDLPGREVRSVVPGQPCTGVWAELAERPGPLALVDYDETTRDLGVCVVAGPR
ncbi:hypothetical protein ACL03H_22140 [Saccharopolyspora sp. MS10]|uniref:hypothetical protein n=1 Tax=Saccharopolyspora sp. MS10 TaxID=3385973 RepID=UPI00399F022D